MSRDIDMNVFSDRYVTDKPLEYSIYVCDAELPGTVSLPSYVYEGNAKCYNGMLAIYSALHRPAKHSTFHPHKLLCLVCFLHVMRGEHKLRKVILDESYVLDVMPWRAPCETTAVYRGSEGLYYLEGCGEKGVYWRSSDKTPSTEPPYANCGALDTNGGCWGTDCQSGQYIEDDLEAFDDVGHWPFS